LRLVTIIVHNVQQPPTSLILDLEAIRRLYWTANIDVSFALGGSYANDPMFASNDYAAIVKRYSTTSNSFGHLIIGREPPAGRRDVAGQLWDPDQRGVAAVYTESDYVLREKNAGLVQTAAHEIGHMLNLSHKDITSLFPSTMNSADARTTDIAAAWQLATTEADTIHPEAYYHRLDEPHACYPLAFQARSALNIARDAQLLPWKGKFDHPLDDLNDEWTCALRV
jgi:hypothetical protein